MGAIASLIPGMVRSGAQATTGPDQWNALWPAMEWAAFAGAPADFIDGFRGQYFEAMLDPSEVESWAEAHSEGE